MIRLYPNLVLQDIDIDNEGVSFQFRLKLGYKMDWRFSKKLLPGSLVIITPDNFKNVFVGLTQ
jgi:hypothetical protein